MPAATTERARASRLLFGSCSSQLHPQPLWPIMERRDAAGFVWGGDAVYADDRKSTSEFSDSNGGDDLSDGHAYPLEQQRGEKPRNRWRYRDATPDYLSHLLLHQRHAQPNYTHFVDTGIDVFGTIDDHDYGRNNGDATFEHGRMNGFVFVRDFLNLPEDSAMYRRAQQGRGVYGVRVYDFDRRSGEETLSDAEAGIEDGSDILQVTQQRCHSQDAQMKNATCAMPSSNPSTPASRNNRRVAVFVLDVRTNKTPWKTTLPHRWQDDVRGDFLGEEQWEWLERSVRRSSAAIHVFVSGVQVHADRIYDGNIIEDWGKYPTAQARLYNTILMSSSLADDDTHNSAAANIIISGDVHFAQFLRKDCFRAPSTRLEGTDNTLPHAFERRTLMEMTTSGLTHAWGASEKFGRAVPLLSDRNSTIGTILKLILHIHVNALTAIANFVNPWTDIVTDEATDAQMCATELNFGELEFDWDSEIVHARIWGSYEDGLASPSPPQPLLYQSWSFQALSDSHVPSKHKAKVDGIDSTTDSGSWTCNNYRGTPNPVHRLVGVCITLTSMLVLPGVCCGIPILLPYLMFVLIGGRKRRKAPPKP